MRIRHITQCKIDCPVTGCDRHRCRRSAVRQLLHPLCTSPCRGSNLLLSYPLTCLYQCLSACKHSAGIVLFRCHSADRMYSFRSVLRTHDGILSDRRQSAVVNIRLHPVRNIRTDSDRYVVPDLCILRDDRFSITQFLPISNIPHNDRITDHASFAIVTPAPSTELCTSP